MNANEHYCIDKVQANKGLRGPRGINGTSGKPGTQGPDGPPGTSGSDGGKRLDYTFQGVNARHQPFAAIGGRYMSGIVKNFIFPGKTLFGDIQKVKCALAFQINNTEDLKGWTWRLELFFRDRTDWTRPKDLLIVPSIHPTGRRTLTVDYQFNNANIELTTPIILQNGDNYNPFTLIDNPTLSTDESTLTLEYLLTPIEAPDGIDITYSTGGGIKDIESILSNSAVDIRGVREAAAKKKAEVTKANWNVKLDGWDQDRVKYTEEVALVARAFDIQFYAVEVY
jgi:hypothetical protein